jgi:hypothetical protein
MRGSDYLLQENKIAFYFRESMPRTYSITFQPGDEIVRVIAKNFNPVNRAEFNPDQWCKPCSFNTHMH